MSGHPLSGGAADRGVGAEVETVGDNVTEVAANMMPWLLSFLMHAGVGLLTMFVVFTSTNRNVEMRVEGIPVTPVWVSNNSDPGGRLHPSDPNVNPMSPHKPIKETDARRATDQVHDKPDGHDAGGGTGSKDPGAIGRGSRPGPGPNAIPSFRPPGSGGPDFGPASGKGKGAGNSIFGTSEVGSKGNSGTIGNAGPPPHSAKRLVYLIDASGSLVDTMPFVIRELKRSVGSLDERQQFTVMFFQGEDVIEPKPMGLRSASATNVNTLVNWLNPSTGHVVPMGGTNPLKALKTALAYKPELIILLSDNINGRGRYELDQRHLLAEIKRLNTTNVQINTIQFLYPDPLESIGLAGTMKQIAEMSHGKFKFVDAKELGIE